MSGLLAGRVWHSDLPSLLKPLAACLADEGNDRGEGIYPSIAYLAWKLGISERSVQRGMARLRQIGVIREVNKKKFGRILVPVYFMDISSLPRRKPWAKSRRGDSSGVSPATSDSSDVTSNDNGVKPVTRRGDATVSPNPLEDPLEIPVGEDKYVGGSDKTCSRTEKRVNPTAPATFVLAMEERMAREWESRVGKKPTWLPRDQKALADLFRMDQITMEEVQRRWLHYLSSQDHFLQSQGWGLRYFCEHFDGYLWGPVNPRQSESERAARREAAVGRGPR